MLPQSAPFITAIGLLLVLGLIEGIVLAFGISALHWLDGILAHESPDGFLGWLHIGRVPLLVLLTLFLTFFALCGLTCNILCSIVFDDAVSLTVSLPLATVAGLAAIRILGRRLARLIPREETYAVSFASLVGRMASMLGKGRHEHPAQAKAADGNGHTLYLMVEPEKNAPELPPGSVVLLVRQINGSHFAAIPNPRPDLLV
nr:OB-fold-containig protein [Dyella mobilis]